MKKKIVKERSKRQSYYSDDSYSKKSYLSKDDYLYSKYPRDKYVEDEDLLNQDGYYGREDYSVEDFAREGGYGHSGGYGGGHGGGYGGGHKVSHGGKKDLYSILAFAAFAFAIGYLIWYCLPDPTRCDGASEKRRRRRWVRENDSLAEVSSQMDFILGLIERAENVWAKDEL